MAAAKSTTSTTTRGETKSGGGRGSGAPAEEQPEPTETTGLLPAGEGEGVAGGAERRDEEQEEQRPHKPCGYRFFMVFSGTATVVSLLMFGTQIASCLVIPNEHFVQYLLRVYVMVLCVAFVLAECQVGFFLRRVPAFASWFHRGFLYSLVGVVVMEESFATIGQAFPQLPTAEFHLVSVLLQVVSTAMFSIGVLYMVMGIFCLKGVWEDLQERYREEIEDAAQLQASAVSVDV